MSESSADADANPEWTAESAEWMPEKENRKYLEPVECPFCPDAAPFEYTGWFSLHCASEHGLSVLEVLSVTHEPEAEAA
jgi:hypothetical protein